MTAFGLFHQIDFAIEADGRFALLPDNDFRASRVFYTLNQHKSITYFNTRAANTMDGPPSHEA